MNRVHIGKEMKPEGFKAAYFSLPNNLRAAARKEICKACTWKIGTYRMKISGRRLFTLWEMRQIEKYFASHDINAWTGEIINK